MARNVVFWRHIPLLVCRGGYSPTSVTMLHSNRVNHSATILEPLRFVDGVMAMGWIRSNLRFGAWCALLALAIQLVLSFGHVHVPRSVGGPVALLAQDIAPPVPPADDLAKPAKPAKL